MHITENELLLYVTEYGLTEQKRQSVEKHINFCNSCQERLVENRSKINSFATENQLECDQVEADLVEYKLGELDKNREEEIKSHLAECENCRYLLSHLQPPTLPILDGTVSKRFPGFPKDEILSLIYQIKSSIGTFISLTIQPLEPTPVFLGEFHKNGAKKILHSGGDIILNINKKGKKVSLFSLHDLELDSQNSDEYGVAIFLDFLPGEYQIQVEDAEIKELQYHNSTLNTTN